MIRLTLLGKLMSQYCVSRIGPKCLDIRKCPGGTSFQSVRPNAFIDLGSCILFAHS